MVVWESMMGVCSYSRRPVKSEDRKLDHVIHSKSHSPEIPFLQFGPVSSEFHSFPEHHQKLRPRVSNIWTQGTFYIQVKIESDISGVLWKNNNKTKQIVNLASSYHIKKKNEERARACDKRPDWRSWDFQAFVYLSTLTIKRRLCPKGGLGSACPQTFYRNYQSWVKCKAAEIDILKVHKVLGMGAGEFHFNLLHLQPGCGRTLCFTDRK